MALGREVRDQPGVRGNGLAQVGARGRMLPGIEGQCARDLKAVCGSPRSARRIEERAQKRHALDRLLQVTKILELAHLIVIDVVIIL